MKDTPDSPTMLEGVEVYRTDNLGNLSSAGSTLKFAAKVIALCGHIPVVQVEGSSTVLYAVRPGLLRRCKQKVRKP